MTENVKGAAIVVGGAVAKGAFAAGALAYVTEKLQREKTPIRALVGTSSGALNATKIANGVRMGEPVAAASELVELWLTKARAWDIAKLDPLSAIRWGGVSGSEKLIQILEEACPLPPPDAGLQPVALRIVVTPLQGDKQPHTSFEHVERFRDAELEDAASRKRMFEAAAASAAFPFAFKPVRMSGLGPCLDGGIVNNTPIKEAIAHDPDIDRVFVILADPAKMRLSEEKARSLAGLPLGLRLLEMLINERLFRDLDEARDVNAWLAALDRMVEQEKMSPGTRGEVIRALYHRDPSEFRHIDIIEIRPQEELKGHPFKAFFDADLRAEYIDLGRKAAERAWRLHEEADSRNVSGRGAPARTTGSPRSG